MVLVQKLNKFFLAFTNLSLLGKPFIIIIFQIFY